MWDSVSFENRKDRSFHRFSIHGLIQMKGQLSKLSSKILYFFVFYVHFFINFYHSLFNLINMALLRFHQIFENFNSFLQFFPLFPAVVISIWLTFFLSFSHSVKFIIIFISYYRNLYIWCDTFVIYFFIT